MRIRDFIWDDDNLEHIARHGVEYWEVEEACSGRYLLLKAEKGKRIILGQTISGRYLFVVLVQRAQGLVRVITARDMTQRERRRYRRGK